MPSSKKLFVMKYIKMCANMVLASYDEENCLESRDYSVIPVDPSTMSKVKPAIILVSNVDTTFRDIDMYFMLQKYGVIRNVISHPASFNFFHRISVKFEREVDAFNVMQKIQGMTLRGIVVDVELITSQVPGDLHDQLTLRLSQLTLDDYSDEACGLPSTSSSGSNSQFSE